MATTRDVQAEYWADLEAYEQRSLAKRPKVRAELQYLPAERYQGPSSAATAASAAVEAIATASAESEDLADVLTDKEDFDYSQESDDEGAQAAAGLSNASRAGEGAERAAMVALPDRYARPGREGWAARNKDKYACQAGGPQVLEQNEKIALQLDKLADTYKTQQAEPWRQYAYSKAAKVVRGITFTVSCASQVRELKGIGVKVAAKIQEIIDTGGLRRLATMESNERMQVVQQLCKVHGVGAATANQWYTRGIRTIEGALDAGLMNEQQQLGARHYEDLQERIPRDEVATIAAAVRAALDRVLIAEGYPNDPGKLHAVAEATPCGSYRRGKTSSGDVDVLICRRDGRAWSGLLGQLLAAMVAGGIETAHLSAPNKQVTATSGAVQSYRGIIKLPGYSLQRRLDLKVYPAEEYAYALLYFTGSDHFNRSMRHYAKAMGYSLSDHGLVRAHKVGANNVVRGLLNLRPVQTEQEIFAALGLDWREPVDRNCEVKPLPKAGGEGTLRVC